MNLASPHPNLVRRLVACAAAAFITASGLRAADDAWPRYAHDGALTGRTALRGDIAEPREAWSISLAGHEVELEFRPRAGRHATTLPGDGPAAERTVPIPGPNMLDLDGSGTLRPAVESYHSRWADILPDVPGLERIAWDQTFTTAAICHLELLAHDQGSDRPRRVWQSEPEGTVFMPLCVVYDIDGDGVQEICVALHYRVMIYEGTTGRKESELKFHSSRSYGWFGLADVDSDGQMELIVLSDFQSHLDVLELDPARPEKARLSVKWRREVEQAIEKRFKWPQIGPNPVVDVTGDGRPEIVINLYNDTGDGQWHTVVLDAATGAVLADLPQRYTQGNADVDGDGAAEIFCTATRGLLVPTYGRVEIVQLLSGSVSVVWSHAGAGFGLADRPRLGRTWSTSASMGMRQVLLSDESSRPAFLIRSRATAAVNQNDSAPADPPATLAAMRYDDSGQLVTLWQVSGLQGGLQTVALAPRDGAGVAAVVRTRLPARTAATLTAEGAAASVVARNSLGTGPFAPIAARAEPGGPMQVFAEGAADNVFAIRPPAAGAKAAEILWQRPGRGITGSTPLGSLAAVDLDGDGGLEVVAAAETTAGAAVLAAYRADGKPYWRHVFEQTPGARPVHNVGALTFWWPGRFRSADQVDLFVNTRRGLMHSDVGHLVDGRTGREVWSRQKAIVPDLFHWGYAGMPLAVADVRDDARDELLNLYPVCFWIAAGATGQLVAASDLAARKALPAWAAYGEPIVYDFTGAGSKQILLDSVYLLALLDLEGNPIWTGKRRRDYPTGQADDNFGETTGVKHALVDFDGDGQPEIASGGYKDGVRAIDPRDGTILWSLEAPTPTGHKCAAANVDGVGGDELLYAAGRELIAITGDRTHGRVLWRWQAPAAVSLPAIADVDNDGQAEIVVQTADGVIHCLDGPAH